MIRGSAITVAGTPAGGLCIRMTGWVWLPPASARVTIRFTQYDEVDVLAFQSSVSTDQFQVLIRRSFAWLSVDELYSPYGGRKRHGRVPTRLRCSALAASIWSPCRVA